MQEQKEYRYEAFISYRHIEPDQSIAAKLHTLIETYRIPATVRRVTGRKKMGRVFRDQEELPLTPNLNKDIQEALRSSRWLIVICSPELLKSKWCMREIDMFIAFGHADRVRILTLLADGEPSNSFPEQLCSIERDGHRIPVEPLAADVRAGTRRGRLRRLRQEKLRLIAPMLNVTYDDLKRRERERRLRVAAFTLSAALVFALAFTGYTLWQNDRVRQQRDIAQDTAVQLLIEKSERSTGDQELFDGVSYALEAYDASRLMGGRYDKALRAAFEYALYPEPFRRVASLKDNGRIHRYAKLSPDDRYAACVEGEAVIALYDVRTGALNVRVPAPNVVYGGPFGFTPEGDGLYILSGSLVTLIAPDTGETLAALDVGGQGYEPLLCGMASGGRVVCRRTDDHQVALIHVRTGDITVIRDAYATGEDSSSRRAVALSPNGKTALITGGEIARLDLEGALRDPVPDSEGCTADLSADGQFIVLHGETTRWLRADTLEAVCAGSGLSSLAALSPDGTRVVDAIDSTDGVRMLDAATGETLWQVSLNSGNTIYDFAFLNGGDYVLASNGIIRVYDTRTGRVVFTPGDDVLTYGCALGRELLLLPVRTGGCVLQLLPDASPLAWVDAYDMDALYAPDNIVPAPLPYEPAHVCWTYELGQSKVFVPYCYYASPDGRYHAILYPDGCTEVFAADKGPAPIRSFLDSSYTMLDAAFCGDVLATCGYVSNVLFYDVTTGDLLGSVYAGSTVTQLCFSPDGSMLIALDAEDNVARVISTQNYEVIISLPGGGRTTDLRLSGSDDLVIDAIGFSLDGMTAVAVLKNGSAVTCPIAADLNELVQRARD